MNSASVEEVAMTGCSFDRYATVPPHMVKARPVTERRVCVSVPYAASTYPVSVSADAARGKVGRVPSVGISMGICVPG
jgi:hypothetical protein